MNMTRARGGAAQPVVFRRNVGRGERLLSLAGAGLAVAGARRRHRTALGGLGAYLLLRGLSGHCLGYRLAGTTSVRAGEAGLLGESEVRVRVRLGVQQPPQVVYRFWRDFEHLPTVMTHVTRIRMEGGRSRWTARGPLGLTWDAHLTHDAPGQGLAWRSVPGSAMDTRGEVRLQPASGGATLMEVELSYRPPGGALARGLGRWLGGLSEASLRRDLEAIRRALEARTETAGLEEVEPGAAQGDRTS